MKPFKKLYDFSLLRGYNEVDIGKKLKEFRFWKNSKINLCEKNLGKIGMTSQVDLHYLSGPGRLSDLIIWAMLTT